MNPTELNLTPTPLAGRRDEPLDVYTARLVADQLTTFAKRCDRIFAALILAQWNASIILSVWFSPKSWAGASSTIHPHVVASVGLGALISFLPIFLAIKRPGRAMTRYVIAASQMAWSGLLIHLTDGRIETHFHVFGSLALLAWYRDRRVLLIAAMMTVVDHGLRGAFFPQSIYGVNHADLTRTLEHAFWVSFELGFLALPIRHTVNEVVETCRMRAALERGYQRVNEEVRLQTAHLARANDNIRANEMFLTRVGQVAGIGGWRIDLETNELVWTEQTRALHEVADDYIPTTDRAVQFYSPDSQPLIRNAVEKAIADGSPWDLELSITTARQNRRYVRAVGYVERREGKPSQLIGAIQDITQRKQAELEIRKLSVVVEQTPTSVVLTNTKGDIEYVNPAFVSETGYSPDEVVGRNCRILKSGLMPAETYAAMWRELREGHEWRGELHNRRKDGELFWVLAVISPVKDASGAITQYMAVEEDITARKQIEDELRVAARTDKLTGLANRALLTERLHAAVARAQADRSYHFAVLFLDFDRFKNVNDSLGHDVGDMLLCQIAKRLRNVVTNKPSLTFAARDNLAVRLGGDEFVVLLDGIVGLDAARRCADELLATFNGAYHLGEHEIYSTASIGIVTDLLAGCSVDDETTSDDRTMSSTRYDADDVLRDADTAMYEAKLAGKARYAIFDVSMRQRVRDRAALENDLRRSLDRGELFLMYQPIVSLTDRTIASFEALVRWRHPQRGLISPGEFVSIAEDTGLIIPIGDWVLREACSRLANWRRDWGDAAPRSISVNISRKQLFQPGLLNTLRQVLQQTQIPPACLHLEITESAVMQDVEAAATTLASIRELGVRLSIDDFGTGYSSLACLRRFAFDTLKIDRSFIANIERGRDFAALVNAISQLARNLRINVVAEGIETIEQAMALQSLDCELGQGNLFSEPLNAQDVPTFCVSYPALPGDGAAA